MPSPFVTELETSRSSQVAFSPVERGGPKGSLVAEIVKAITRTDQQPWRADFREGSLNTTEDWQTPVIGSGMTLSATTGNAVISTGTTANAETYIRSKRQFTFPVRVQVSLMLTQRIANQEFYVELTNAAGDVFSRWKFDGTVNTTAKVETSAGTLNQSLNNSVTTTATSSQAIFELDMAIDEVNFRNRTLNSASASSERATRSDNLPHTDDVLYLQLRAKNLSTAPASSTDFSINHVMVQDVNELAVEVVGGRGTTGANTGIYVNPSALVASNSRIGFTGVPGIWQDTSTATLAASATFTGTARDLWATAANTMTAISSAYPKEYRAMAISDVTGTLNLEVSRDNVTFRRIQSVATSNTNTGGLFVATLNYAPVFRYARIVYVNGAGAQTHFTLGEAYLAG